MGKKVKIKVWVVYGEQSKTLCFTEEEANRVNMGLGGWGDIKEEVKVAKLVEEET